MAVPGAGAYSESPEVEFSPLDPDFCADPYPVFRALRQSAPVHWHETFQAWIVSRYDDVRALFADDRLTLDPAAWQYHQPTSGPPRGFCEWFRGFPILRKSGPDGLARARRLVHAAFTPRAMRRIEAQVREHVDACIEAVADRLDRGEEIDLVEAYASAIPLPVIGRILGIAPDGARAERFRRDAWVILGCMHPFLSPEAEAHIDRTGKAFCDYVTACIHSRQATPTDDLLSDIVNATDETGTGLDDESLLALIIGLLVVGTETTAHVISMGIGVLARNPEQRARLLDGSVAIADAVEEILRIEPPSKLIIRYAREPLEVGGHRIEKGQLVMLLPTSANHDEAKFADPDRLDLGRDASDHLSFGLGPHFCLGAWLARMQLQLAIGSFTRRFPDVEVREDGVTWIPGFMFRGPRTMPVRRIRASRD